MERGGGADGGHLLHGEVTGAIIGAAFEVWSVFGYGFLEKVYEKALVEELARRKVQVSPQHEIQVRYKGVAVGHYAADLFVEGKVIVEIKADRELASVHEAQLLNYLKATGVRVGLLLNFGLKACRHKRMVW